MRWTRRRSTVVLFSLTALALLPACSSSPSNFTDLTDPQAMSVCQRSLRNTLPILDAGIVAANEENYPQAALYYHEAADTMSTCLDVPEVHDAFVTIIREVDTAADLVQTGDVAASDLHFYRATAALIPVADKIAATSV